MQLLPVISKEIERLYQVERRAASLDHTIETQNHLLETQNRLLQKKENEVELLQSKVEMLTTQLQMLQNLVDQMKTTLNIRVQEEQVAPPPGSPTTCSPPVSPANVMFDVTKKRDVQERGKMVPRP